MISPAMILPPTVLIRNGGIKNQAAAALFKKKRAMTQADPTIIQGIQGLLNPMMNADWFLTEPAIAKSGQTGTDHTAGKSQQ